MRCNICKLNEICRQLRQVSTDHFRCSFHNLLAHPISEIAYLLGFKELSNKIHDKSIPVHLEGTGRG